MIKYVTTRVGYGTKAFFSYSGPHTWTLTATPIVPSSYSMVEVISTNSSTSGGQPGNVRYWSYHATEDGALRIDPMLSMPGPNAHLDSYVSLTCFRIVNFIETDTSTNYSQEVVPIHVDGSAPGLGVQYLYYSGQAVGPSGSTGNGSIKVEAGSTYIFQLTATRQSFVNRGWGASLRVSSLRTTASDGEVWYQLPNRTVTTRSDPVYDTTPYNNNQPIETWDKIWGKTNPVTGSVGQILSGFSHMGSFEWNRSFHGLDPITQIGSYLAVTHAWQQTTSTGRGVFPIIYAAPGFDGTLQGVPGEYPFAPAHYGTWGGGGIQIEGPPAGIGAWNKWSASTSGLGFFEYADSKMACFAGGLYMSLHYEAWSTGKMVYYTSTEMCSFADVDPGEVVGFVYEDVLPEITRVQVIPDWRLQAPVATTWEPAPAQWWVSKMRYRPDISFPSGSADPDPEALGVGWGPYVYNGTHPGGNYIPAPLWVAGDGPTGPFPAGYINEMGMVHLGDYESTMHDQATGSLTTWEVPEEVWRASWDLEEVMDAYEVLYSTYRDPDSPDFDEYAYRFYQPMGMSFLTGTSEALATYPIGPGVAQPSLEAGNSNAKGLHGLMLWPKITYKPTRYKIVYAPELEYPLLEPTGGPLTLRQHFSPLLGGGEE